MKTQHSLATGLAYDAPSYGACLRHHGEPVRVEGWSAAVIQRPIPSCSHHDSIGPWPYATLPHAPDAIQRLRTSLVAQGLISFSACARPDSFINRIDWETAGFEVQILKPHYVHRPTRPPPPQSAKTRANLRKARRYWHVEISPIDAVSLRQMATWHSFLNLRKDMSPFTRLPPEHFQALLACHQCNMVVASDEHGPGASVLVMAAGNEIHCHAQAGDDRAYRLRGFYALYQEIIERWAKSHTIYLGGVPDGTDGPGIARFKSRFANDTAPVYMVRAILNPEISLRLAQSRGNPSWFPPYRSRTDQQTNPRQQDEMSDPKPSPQPHDILSGAHQDTPAASPPPCQDLPGSGEAVTRTSRNSNAGQTRFSGSDIHRRQV